jgi:outer membrane beta-barrel protein
MSARVLLLLSVVALVPAQAFAQAAEDEAGDVSEVDKDASGPLRDRIRPVSGHRFLMKGRFEASPGFGVSLRDAFFRKWVFGAALTFHFSEELALSARGGYSLPTISGAANICTQSDPANGVIGGCRQPSIEDLTLEGGVQRNKAYGLIGLLASLDLQWAPLYGKISLIAESFLQFNMYAIAGAAIVTYGPTGQLAPGGNLGLGFRFFVNRWLTVRLELRDTIYYEEGFFRTGTTTGGPPGSLRNQLSTELGLSMFFPMEFEEGRQ